MRKRKPIKRTSKKSASRLTLADKKVIERIALNSLGNIMKTTKIQTEKLALTYLLQTLQDSPWFL